MNTELDYDLTPDQWETLKALRAPASMPRKSSRHVLESLVALELVALCGDFVLITAKGPDQGFVAVAGCGSLTAPSISDRRRQPKHGRIAYPRNSTQAEMCQAATGRCPRAVIFAKIPA
jgi:hypothetical protein